MQGTKQDPGVWGRHRYKTELDFIRDTMEYGRESKIELGVREWRRGASKRAAF